MKKLTFLIYFFAVSTCYATGGLISATGGSSGSGGGVTSLNGNTGAQTIVAGTNISISTTPSTLTINSTASGGGGTTQFASQLLDCQVIIVDSTHLAFASSATVTQPCIAQVGSTAYLITSSATITLGAVSTTVKIYVSAGDAGDGTVGTLQVRNSASSGITCTSAGTCNVQNSQSSFPTSYVALGQWTATSSGIWDSTGTNYRPLYSTKPSPTAGPGTIVTAGDRDTIAVDFTAAVHKYSGIGQPIGYANGVRGDIYLDVGASSATTTLSTGTWICNSPASCTSTGAGGWTLIASSTTSGGGSSTITEEVTGQAAVCQSGNPSPGGNWSFGNPISLFCSGTNADNGPAAFPNVLTATGTFTVGLPANWNGGTIGFSIRWAQSDGGSGGTNVQWKFATACMGSGDSTTPSYNADQSVLTATPATTTNAVSTISSLTTTGCAAGKVLKIRVTRDDSIGSNYGFNAYLSQGTFTYSHT